MEATEMKTGWHARWFIILGLMIISTCTGWAQILEIRRLNDGILVQDDYMVVQLMRHEVVGIEIIAHFANGSQKDNYLARLQRYWGTYVPGYVEGWEDQADTLAPGEVISLRNVLYIRPIDLESIGKDSIMIVSMMRHGSSPQDYLELYQFKIKINVRDMEYEVPDIVAEPAFTQGLSNTIYYHPSPTSSTQDVYCFDAADRENLKKSVQRLYRAQQGDTLHQVFEGLVDGHTYGYFVKAEYQTDRGPIWLYTDFTYSTQDNSPPPRIVEPQATIIEDDIVRISWNTVSDEVSGTARYRIFRAIDTGPEELLIDFSYTRSGPISWNDRKARYRPGVTYFYRITAVDAVGNEGDGDRTNGIWFPGESDPYVPPTDTEDIDTTITSGDGFLKGTVDTLWLDLDGRERFVRFEAVRDSMLFFDSPPSIPMRYFRSGWVSPNTLRNMGWVSPTRPDSVYFVFDYTDTGGVFIDDEGVVHHDTGGTHIDKHFVNGHTYHRRASRQYFSAVTFEELGPIIPDCFPPDDIHNLQIENIIEDPDFQDPTSGYTKWHIQVSWDSASDAVSGLKRYRVYRWVEGIDSSFVDLNFHEYFKSTSFIDTLAKAGRDTISNPMIYYRIVTEDNVGNQRALNETGWEVNERSLGEPHIVFDDTTFTDIFPPNPGEVDTIFTKDDFVLLKIVDFDASDVVDYAISINEVEVYPLQMYRQDMFTVQLPDTEVVRIKVRALYLGNRSSIWSTEKVVVRVLGLPPENLLVWNDSTYWEGNIHLQWQKPSIDTDRYEIWRWNEAGDSTLIGNIHSLKDTVRWDDYYGYNELLDEPGDTLLAYEMYKYKVRKINIFSDTTVFCAEDSAYCNRAPRVYFHQIAMRNEQNVIIIYWERVHPSKAQGSWRTRIRVSVDTLSDIVFTSDETNDPVDATSYVYSQNVVGGYNYIFEIKEIPDGVEGRVTNWSKPYTVNMAPLDSLFVVPQPKGRVFLSWEEDTLVDRLLVDAFRLTRQSMYDTLNIVLPDTIQSYMDSVGLQHARQYAYTVSALDSLDQIVATNTHLVYCDTGLVFIPDSAHIKYHYFNYDSIDVSWQWKDIDGNPLTHSTRGAAFVRIQTSVSKLFPLSTGVTHSTAWFPADTLNRSRKVRIPDAVNTNNDTVYCRITAQDRWGNPLPSLWSATSITTYDPFDPNAVDSLWIASTEAYYGGVDSILAKLRWSGWGVEWPPTESEQWTKLIGNIALYRIFRGVTEADSRVVGEVPVHVEDGAIDTTFTYEFPDTTRNAIHQWRIVSVDSAGNEASSRWVPSITLTQTPNPPEPTGYKACDILPIPAGDNQYVEYFVEIAVDPQHFEWAYEIDGGALVDRILCRSGWIDSLNFECFSGWGAVVRDTTWFRVRARADSLWESGWSTVVFYAGGEDGTGKTGIADFEGQIPTVFDVHHNMPNPFNAQTVIPYQLPEQGYVEIRVFNIMGSLVKTLIEENKPAGYYSVIWNGTDKYGRGAASGIYFYHVLVKLPRGKTVQKWMKMTMIK